VKSRLIRGLAAAGQLRVLAVDSKRLVEEARRRHTTSASATAALGRALSGAALLAQLLSKGRRERVTLIIDGDGPLGGLVAEAGVDGRVRGYVKNPDAEVEPRADGKLNVGALIGSGQLRVIRALASGEQYDSTVPLQSGEIAEDIAYYLWQSEQQPAALLLGVMLAPSGEVASAGGLLLQVTPDAGEEVLARLQDNLSRTAGFSSLLHERGLQGAAQEVLRGLDLEWRAPQAANLEELAIDFVCRCSREKALVALSYFTPQEREEMIAEDGGAEVVCHWCGAKYTFSPEQLRSLNAREQRCPDCGTLWYESRADGVEVVYPHERCKCGRKVDIVKESPSA